VANRSKFWNGAASRLSAFVEVPAEADIRLLVSPAYDMLSTIPYIKDDTAALRYAKTKKMTEFSWEELSRLAAKAQLPGKPVLDAAEEAIERFRAVWGEEQQNLPLTDDVVAAVEAHAARVPIFNEKRR
jgi:serine/threonine-protein kinase HipA